MLKKTVSYLASGRGSNFSAVAEKIKSGGMKAVNGVLVCDRKNAGAFKIAKKLGITSFFIDPADFAAREDYDRETASILEKNKTDLIVAAGYMRILTPWFVNRFSNRIINIHPALLPSFPGIHSQKKALDYGVKITGCTAHFVDEGTDTGPVIMQAAVSVLDSDTEAELSLRILKEEHRILPEAVRLFCEGKLKVSGRRVLIKK